MHRLLTNLSLGAGSVLLATCLTTSTVGGRLRLVAPWPTIGLRLGAGAPVALTPDATGIVALDTAPGERFVLAP